MAVNYEKYIQLLADSIKRVYGEMAKKQTDSYVVKASKSADAGDYAVGIVVPYDDWKAQLSAQFILGLTDRKKAVRLAAAIPVDTGMPVITEFDDRTARILDEFMTAAVGQTGKAWDKLGLTTRFGKPVSLGAQQSQNTLNTIRDTYIVTLSVTGESIALFVTFEEIVKTVLTGKKILVVDDSRMIRMVLTKALKKQGCVVVEAVDGKDAVEKFDAEQPELTITDMVMPNMGGLEAIGRIKKKAPQAKVLVLTSTAGKKEVMAAAALGIRGYVKKPVKPEKLIEAAIGCFN
jgi:two-component system, chemotaxis family, chemotaxis protein CheY